ncbi:MAG: alpha/beta hydrolase [Bacteroidota bacterium]
MIKRLVILGVILLWGTACDLEHIDLPNRLVPETVDTDTELPFLMINGTKLHLETFGEIDRPILIFLHGGPGSDYRAMISEDGVENVSRYPNQRQFASLGLSQLQNDYYCIFYDRRGAGLSPRFAAAEVTLQDQIDDLDALVDYFLYLQDVNSQHVNLFGLSFGGYLATAYINQHPSKVHNVVLYEPRPFTEAAFDLLDLTSPFEQLGANWIDEQTSSGTHIIPDSHERMDYLRAIGASNNSTPEFNESRSITYWRLGAQVFLDIENEIRRNKPNIVNRLENFAGNMLFLYGENTEAAPNIDAYLNEMTSHYPNSSTIEIPNAAHNGHWDNPVALSNAIRTFIQ